MMRRTQGFTLIEILVAVAIFGLLSVGAYTVLDAGMRSRAQTESRLSRLEMLQRAIQVIEKDLRMISLRLVRDEFGDKLPLLKGQSEESGQQFFLEFTRADWRNPAGLPRSNLQHVIYRFDQGKLERLHTIFLDQASNSPKITRTLLEDVNAFSLEFLNEQNQWKNDWSILGLSDAKVPLPKAIKIKFELEPFGEIERLIVTAIEAEKSQPEEEQQ